MQRLLALYAILITTPIASFYLYSGALELQAGALLGVSLSGFYYLLAINRDLKSDNRIALCSITTAASFLFSLYKDFFGVYLLVAMLGSFVCYSFYKRNRTNPPLPIYPVLSALFGALSNIGYSLLRFGTAIPTPYLLEKEKWQPSLTTSFEYLSANIFSPNGGILAFWGVGFAVAIIFWLSTNSRPALYPVGTAFIVITLFILSSSVWWAPFGWDAWGNRLTIPGVLGSLILLISSSEPTRRGAGTFFALNLLGIAFIMSAISFQLLPYRHTRAESWNSLLFGSPSCHAMLVKLSADGNSTNMWSSDLYLNCAKERLWLRQK